MEKLLTLCVAVFLVGLVAGAGHESDGHSSDGGHDHHNSHDDHEESMCMKQLMGCRESYKMNMHDGMTVEEKMRELNTFYGCVERVECHDDDDAESKRHMLHNIAIDLETTPPIMTCAEMMKKCWDTFEGSRDFEGFINCVEGLKGNTDLCASYAMGVVNSLVDASNAFLNYLQMSNLCPACTDTGCASGLEQCRQTFLQADAGAMELDLVLTFHDCVKDVPCPADQQNHREDLRKAIESMLMTAKKAVEESDKCDSLIEDCRSGYMEHGQSLEGTRAFKKCVIEVFCPADGIKDKKDLLYNIRQKIMGYKEGMMALGSFVKPAVVTMTLAMVLALFFK